MLQAMRRPERRATILERVGWLREAIPDLTLRTTVIVGFPGETEDTRSIAHLKRDEAPLSMLVPTAVMAVAIILLGLFNGDVITHLIQHTVPAGFGR